MISFETIEAPYTREIPARKKSSFVNDKDFQSHVSEAMLLFVPRFQVTTVYIETKMDKEKNSLVNHSKHFIVFH